MLNLLKMFQRTTKDGEIQLVRNNYEIEEDGTTTTKEETIAYITAETPLRCYERRTGIKQYGYNLNAVINDELVLLETYDDTDEITGRELGENVIQSIKDGFTAGAVFFRVPSN